MRSRLYTVESVFRAWSFGISEGRVCGLRAWDLLLRTFSSWDAETAVYETVTVRLPPSQPTCATHALDLRGRNQLPPRSPWP